MDHDQQNPDKNIGDAIDQFERVHGPEAHVFAHLRTGRPVTSDWYEDVVERAARAGWEACSEKPWEDLQPETRDAQRIRTRAVLRVGWDACEPTEQAGMPEGPSPKTLRVLAEWFDNPNKSPYIVCPGTFAEASPGMLLRQIANELELKLNRLHAEEKK